MSDSSPPCGLHHTRWICLSLSPGVCSNSCILSQWCHLTHPLLPFSPLPSTFPSIRVFSSESALCIRGPKYWSFSFRISPSNEYLGLVSFRIDWFGLFVVQGTLLQYHSLKASILLCSAFFMVQLSCPYMTTGKTWRKTGEGNGTHSSILAWRTLWTVWKGYSALIKQKTMDSSYRCFNCSGNT